MTYLQTIQHIPQFVTQMQMCQRKVMRNMCNDFTKRKGVNILLVSDFVIVHSNSQITKTLF